ncbi:glycosyltransferase [Ichthyenterobacterium sp. W332]|uniref:Glycosyltransferase n=1 Tax=Microcosmobacter mediterraneus TaxID=3075607 RepID=A0ABU2YJU9_9FLAO|nr:glycosyltransferase [Ichthyenterobacterium sp. W332]MDT0558312.1 glycosyltransferase [Ichthyenterobacterium sp. W332]
MVLDIVFYSFTTIIAIQLIYYLGVFMPFVAAKPKPEAPKNIPVSIIICCKNEADNLKQNLPYIIEQDYRDFEIILIDDYSKDDTLEIMKSFKDKHQNIKVVEVKPIDAFWGNKKYALTLGIKAATHNFLLFTDADCTPNSKQWISKMTRYFSNEKSMVLGYGAYKKRKYSLLNKLIRYETLLAAIQYFSFAKIGMPYMGVGRNLAYRKELFFNASGFMNHMNIRSGDDDLFVNQVATKTNVALSYETDSFTLTEGKTSLISWFNQKRRHVSTAKHYKTLHKFSLSLFYITQLLLWVSLIILLSAQFQLIIVLCLFGLRILSQSIVIHKGSKRFNERDLLLLFPFLELFLVLFQMAIFITNQISKPVHWK